MLLSPFPNLWETEIDFHRVGRQWQWRSGFILNVFVFYLTNILLTLSLCPHSSSLLLLFTSTCYVGAKQMRELILEIFLKWKFLRSSVWNKDEIRNILNSFIIIYRFINFLLIVIFPIMLREKLYHFRFIGKLFTISEHVWFKWMVEIYGEGFSFFFSRNLSSKNSEFLKIAQPYFVYGTFSHPSSHRWSKDGCYF